jgi:hypothetical protein
MRLELHPEAIAEVDHALVVLERERPGHGRLMLAELGRVVAFAEAFPAAGTRVDGCEEKHDVRRFLLRRFRYAVITALAAGDRKVIAVAHTSREPGYWKGRLEGP